MTRVSRITILPFLVLGALAGCSEPDSEQQEIDTKKQEAAPARARHINSELGSNQADVRNGIKIESLGGRAFIATDFGSAPTGDAETVVNSLKDSALSGNAKTSYAIHLKVRECVSMMRNFERKGLSAVNSKKYEDCKNLSPENFSSASEWLERAANQGHLGAQLLYVADPESIIGNQAEMLRNPENIQRYKESAVGYLRAAAARGSVDALLSLGNAYRVGTLTDLDPATSYAYYQAVERINPEYVSKASMEALKKELTQQQIELSRTKSMEIYNECCKSK